MSRATWNVDASHTTVEFSVRHLMIATVKGYFNKVSGTIEADPNDLTTAVIDASVEAASIDTRDEQRDAHLRSADFFEADVHPTLTLKSTKIERVSGNDYKMHADLTIRGKTLPTVWDLTFEGEMTDPFGNHKIGLSATTKINRKDWGLNWNAALETGGVLVSDEVKIAIDAQAVKA